MTQEYHGLNRTNIKRRVAKRSQHLAARFTKLAKKKELKAQNFSFASLSASVRIHPVVI